MKKNKKKLKKELKKGFKPVKKLEFKINFDLKKILTWLLVAFVILSFIFSLQGPAPQGKKSLAEVLKDVKAEKIEKIEVEGENLFVTYKNNELYQARKEPQESLTEVLNNAQIDPSTVDFEVKDQSMLRVWGSILEIILPVILTGIIFLWIFRQARGAQDSIFSFGKSKAKLFAKGKQSVTFADVGDI